MIPLGGTELETLLLEKHNEYRNQIAEGSVKSFPQAARMTKVTWNEELSHLAELNSKRCVFEHDKCRGTAEFPYAGQAIAYYDTAINQNYNNERVIKKMMEKMFNEYFNVDVEDIESINTFNKDGFDIGNFLQIAQDKANQIGCGLADYIIGNYRRLHLVCNYSYGNIRGGRVYEEGESCSLCETGCSDDYPALCNENEVVPNTP